MVPPGISSLFCFLALSFSLVSAHSKTGFQVKRQAPNTIYNGNELVQTGSWNLTHFILPISKTEAQSLAGDLNLLTPTGLPDDFLKEDEHPLFFTTGLQADIRQIELRVDELLTFSVYLPFVDAAKDGKSSFSKQVQVYANQLIPSLVSSLLYLNRQSLATFDPPRAAYRAIGSEVGVTISQGLDNTIDGPGLLIPRFQGNWNFTSTSTIPAKTFQDYANQPYAKPGIFDGLCGLNTFFYNETFANPSFVEGTLQVYDPILSKPQIFKKALGYTVVTEWLAESGPGKKCTEYV